MIRIGKNNVNDSGEITLKNSKESLKLSIGDKLKLQISGKEEVAEVINFNNDDSILKLVS